MRPLVFVLALVFAHPAAALTLNGVTLDPDARIRPAILSAAVDAWRAHPQARRDVLAIADFGRTSTEPRFAIVDLATGAVDAMATAHGKGSDPGHDGLAETFTDAPGSNATALGAYLTGGRYQGGHGLSLRLEGLEASNRNAAARAIVVHSAPYMSPGFIAAHGRPGRSWGCIVVDPVRIGAVVDRLEGGALIYAGR
ncbi:MAG: hypothetical protein EBZ50_05165 [Alphaproteobacteria bacterium]|nr:hypothetical protein [Alphaproteobacteria bacterium]